MSMIKHNLKSRLAKYGVLAAAITGANDAGANVIYTDEIPDFAGGVGSQYFLDLNNDAIDDFRIWHNGSSNLYISPLTATNEVLGSGGATFAYPFALSIGATVSSGAGGFFNNGFAGGFQSLNYGSCSFGNWCTVTDRYIGLRFDIGGSIHYGWVRLDVNQSGSVWSVKDYAYEDVVGASLLTGDLGVPSASASSLITGTDISDNGNGLDLEVDFVAGNDETTLSEYRVIAVKEALFGTFDQLTAEALPMANYMSIIPNGSANYTQAFTAGSVDSDGDLLILNQPYRLYVLNMADGVNVTLNSLSVAGAPVTLNTVVNAANAIVVTDVSNNTNASDIQLDFDAAISEVGIEEYRAMIVKDAAVASFNLVNAQSIPSTAYDVITPGMGSYSINFNAATTDTDGDALILSQPYTVFILSVSDSINANIDSLSLPSASLTLTVTTDVASSIVGTDIMDNGNGLDLQVDFDAAVIETGILAYRVIAVKESAAGTFTLSDGLALPSSAWMFINPTTGGASSYTTIFEANKTDSDGDPIVENQPYHIFVLSFADTQLATVSDMSSSTNTVTLISYVGIAENNLDALRAFTSHDGVTINTPTELLGQNLIVELVSIQGKVVESVQIMNQKTILNSSKVKSGVYFVNFTNDNGTIKTVKIYI